MMMTLSFNSCAVSTSLFRVLEYVEFHAVPHHKFKKIASSIENLHLFIVSYADLGSLVD
jgi:hypothetical protein